MVLRPHRRVSNSPGLIAALTLFAGFLLPGAMPLLAQDTGPSAVSAPLIEQRIKEIEAASDMDDETKLQLQEQYRRALGYLEAAEASKKTRQQFASARETAPELAKKERDTLAKLEEEQSEVQLDISEDTAASDIEQLLNQEKANRAAVDAKLNDLEQRLKTEANRPAEIRQRLIEARDQTGKLAEQLNTPAPATESARDTEARRWVLQTHAAAVSAEIQALDQELLSQPMRIQLLQAQRDRSARSLGRMDTRVKLLEEALGKRRQSEAEEAVDAAKIAGEDAERLHPLAKSLADKITELGNDLKILTANLEATIREDADTRAELKRIEDENTAAQQKLEVAGLSQTLGVALQEVRQDLPDVRVIRRQSRARENAIANAGLKGLQYEEERRNLRDLGAYVDGLFQQYDEQQLELRRSGGDSANSQAQAYDRETLREPLLALAASYRDLLDRVIDTNDDYIRAMTELDFVSQRLLTTSTEFERFLDERLLWVRSADPVDFRSTLELPGEVVNFLAPSRWTGLVATYWYEIRHSPLLLLAILLFIGLMAMTPRFVNAIRATAKKVRRISTDAYRWTAEALGYSLLLTLAWPLLSLSSGWYLYQSLEGGVFEKAAGFALLRITPALFFLRGFRVLCMGGGVGEVHFKWSPTHLKRLRGQIDRFMIMFLVPLFILITTFRMDPGAPSDELGKLAFVFLLVGMVLFFDGLFRPEKGVFTGLRPEGFSRSSLGLKRAIYLVLIIVPIALAILMLAGYIYTAGEIVRRVVTTMWLLLGLIVIHELALRWLLLVRRKLRLKQARERRAAALAAQESEEQGEGSSDDIPMHIDEPEVDIVSLDSQTRKLVNAGLLVLGISGIWLIWSSVLPALGILDQITVWSQIETINGEPTAVPVTLATLGKALLIAILTIVAAKNLPSLLEIILLQRLDITSGSRLAVSTLARYGIAAFGTMLFLSTIGGSWSKIQWLVAALSVGIGFGLQEIVANFISGLIILLERPVRVGDTVTVGDTSGIVTRIQIRATTITNWERQELLVPNKEFITGRVLNWTLTDEVIRLSIPVGVAYGSNVEQALELMYQAAVAHPRILEDPPPFVMFDSFGDNSLNLIVRAYVNSIAYRRETTSDLNREINRLFNEHGIVISFPQRDVHLDTLSPLEIRLHRDSDAAEPA
jgi:potassium efflux system protein